VQNLERVRYTREHLHQIAKVNNDRHPELIVACFELLTRLNLFLHQALRYLSRKIAVNLVVHLFSSSLDEANEQLKGARKNLDRVLQDHVNLLQLANQQAQARVDLVEWATKLDFGPVQGRHRRAVCTGTGIWFLQTNQIERYINGELQWIRCVGAGKSHTRKWAPSLTDDELESGKQVYGQF
jgi:hypothetical protein